MPLYRFAEQGEDPVLVDPPEALDDDVEAMKVAAEMACDLAKGRDRAPPLVVLIRVGSRPKQ
jgi:hypothetical protein